MMKVLIGVLAWLLAALAAPAPALAQAAAQNADQPLILISIDGFRWDYLDRGISPNLSALAKAGVRAERMIPSFPSVTFPNHYTLVTGLYPDHHGIVNNSFTDPALPGSFTMASKEEQWWNQGKPLWTSAEAAGIPTATFFWPGSETALGGIRPGLWRAYDHSVTPSARVDGVLGWLDLPPAQRPRFITLYFEPVDSAGHSFGPDSPEVNQAIATVDGAIGRLRAGLVARHVEANLVVVSDHGMAPVAPDHAIVLDQLIDLTSVHVVFTGTIAGIDLPDTPAARAAEVTLIAPQPHMTCWPKAAIPARLHYGSNPRVPALICSPETGWLIDTRAGLAHQRATYRTPERGAHGYDNADPLMGALFIAAGPAFRQGLTIAPFPNVDVYPLLAHLISIQPQPGDGTFADLAPILK